jgi:hypothetical protein
MPLLRPRPDLDPPITHREESAWASAVQSRNTAPTARARSVSALHLGLVEWTRMQRWITKYGEHPRVLRWLDKNHPPAGWMESWATYAYTEMPFAPGWWSL